MKSDPIKDFGYTPYQVEKYRDYIGTTIGKWKVIDFAPNKNGSRKVYFLCECQCEYHTVCNVDVYNLINGRSKCCRRYDPPYSPRQVSECYKQFGYNVTMTTTQASFWSEHKKQISRIVKLGGKR